MVEPADVVDAADFVVRALTPAVGRDWSVRAGRLEWDVDHTLAHATGAVAKYALYLASRSSRFIAVAIDPWPDATQQERLDAIGGVARAFANVAGSVPPGTRAYHSSGMVDAEGYSAQACVEMLVHGHDVAEGLGLTYDPPVEICEAVVARVFPWLADAGPAWQTMLWHTGRIDIAGRPSSDDAWRAVAIPLSEWDGTIPRRDPRPVVEWLRDEAAGRWEPRYLDQT